MFHWWLLLEYISQQQVKKDQKTGKGSSILIMHSTFDSKNNAGSRDAYSRSAPDRKRYERQTQRSAGSISLKDMLHTETLWFFWLDLDFYLDAYSATPASRYKEKHFTRESVCPASPESFKPAALPLWQRGSLRPVVTLLLLWLFCRFVPFKVL